MPTEQDWKLYQSTRTVQDKTRAFTQRLIEQAEVDAAKLTGHPEWDRYLQRIQTLLDEAIQAKATWQDAYNRAFSEHHRNQAQVELHRHLAVIDTLERVINIPKEILTHATLRRTEGDPSAGSH